ncbi:MAG: PUR family DNA/RNA-binding protein [Bacteroidaceae bacterium]|nr:PUR family DNA/RNA-binding protein [Bacteroidaceae bacterium]
MDFEKDIVYSQAIKAGKRIYYLDVKRNKKGELFLSITESKRISQGDGTEGAYSFEKHKIFLYQEDFSKFISGLSQVIGYIHEHQTLPERFATSDEEVTSIEDVIQQSETSTLSDDLKIDIDFE